MSAGEAKPKGGERRAIDPTGQNYDFLGVCTKHVQKPSRPISAGKAKPKGCERRAIDPKGQN